LRFAKLPNVPVHDDDFAEFYEVGYGWMVAMVGDRGQDEDIAQETFARALTRWAQVLARAALKAGPWIRGEEPPIVRR
jgi:DNA-directed RNA polymerase specialized sigma24 family protein